MTGRLDFWRTGQGGPSSARGGAVKGITMNKKIVNFDCGGASLNVAIFDKSEHAKQGECVIYMSVRNEAGTAEVRSYFMPENLLALGHALIDAALLAEKVQQRPGYLTKYETKQEAEAV